MDAAAYLQAQEQLLDLMKDLLQLDVGALVDKMDEEEAEGPKRDPAAWCRQRERFQALHRAAVAFKGAAAATEEYRALHVARLSKEKTSWERGTA